MKLSNISLPYPVLGVNDDVTPLLPEDAVIIKFDKSNPTEYRLSVSLKFDNPDIECLINEGYANYICEVDCVKTNLRKSIPYNKPEFEFTINSKSVSGNVELSCYVTVIKPINNYVNRGFHEDYKGAIFNLTPGDILVGFPIRSFVADPTFDKLKSATSFMQIRQDKDHTYTNFEFTSKTIDIKLPTELFNIFNSGVGISYAEVIHSSLAHSALLAALYEINNYSNSQWAQAIVELLNNDPDLKDFYTIDNGSIQFTDAIHVATMLLKDPYNRMFRKLDSMNPSTSMFSND